MDDPTCRPAEELPNSTLFRFSTAGRKVVITERRFFRLCLAGAALPILGSLVTPRYSAVFLEYIFKFVPAFSDRGWASIFDGFLVGDPRGRPVANFFGYITFIARQWLLGIGPIPPTLSISWLLYPAILFVFSLAVRTISHSWRTAAMAVVLLAFSPALLDFFVDYYIPAKPLVLFFFVSALFGTALIVDDSNKRPNAKLIGAAIAALSLLLGLLSDETGAFIAICIPIMFVGWFFSVRASPQSRLMFIAGFALGGTVYILILLAGIPAINNALGQKPLNMPLLVLQGVYRTMFGADSIPLGNLFAQGYSPQGIAQTILSAHLIPFRSVTVIWTGPTLDPWRFREISAAAIACTFWFNCLVRAPTKVLRQTCWIAAAFVVFIFLQALLILRLAPYIAEVNYYANISSIFIALLISFPVAAWSTLTQNPSRLRTAWIAIAVVAIIELVNFVATAGRHPMFLHDAKPLTWSELAGGYRAAREGQFPEWARNHPYPSRAFLWAFEAAAAKQKAKNLEVDLRPFAATPDTPLKLIDFAQLIDPKVPALTAPLYRTERELQHAGAKPVSASEVMDLRAHELRGRFGIWEFRWRRTAGGVEQQSWRAGLMRLWSEQGLPAADGRGCPRFPHDNLPCADRYYVLGSFFFGVYSGGSVQLVLKAEEPT